MRGGERVPHRGGDPDSRRPAHGQGADRLGYLGGRAALQLDDLGRQPALVEQDDTVVLEPDDVLGPQIVTGYVPSSQEDR
jgi:hypothetical protein